MKKAVRLIMSICFVVLSFNVSGQTISKQEFKEPSIEYWPRPLWFWNDTTVTSDVVLQQMQDYKDLCGYGGFGILPYGKEFKPEYLSADYFNVYGKALKRAKELGLTMWLYDEYGFPSGSAGARFGSDNIARFQQLHPEETISQLNKTEEEIKGPALYHKSLPEGRLMGIVAMETSSLKRIPLTNRVHEWRLNWEVPEGTWKIMFFYCVKSGEPVVDYLNAQYVQDFIKMTHDAYYDQFKEYFGTAITGTFFDEPSMFHAKYRMWTGNFNGEFEKKYGFNPEILYPALWYDIGTETQSARNYLFGFRAELYAKGFTKEVNDWSVAHGITATGHTAPEEVLNPVNSAGDLMKSFKYLSIPGIDKIGGDRPAERFYKVVSSSAYNWDKSLVMSETYGAMPNYDEPGNIGWNEIFSIAMDQYCKGINMLIPSAVWYNNKIVTYKPELSHTNPLYADSLKVFNIFLSRLNFILQKEGRHVADIAILYPIHSLQGDYFFDGPAGPANEMFKGRTQIDYIDVSNWLITESGKDFTFLHPEVLDEKCRIADGILQLQNKINREEYKVLVVPSCSTISISNLQKIADFYLNGGTVIFTTRLPKKSAETGKDSEVERLVHLIFPEGENDAGKLYAHEKGGKAFFIKQPNGQNLQEALKQTAYVFDVDYPVNKDMRYIHKVIDGKDIFYFANIGGESVNIPVTLRGNLKLKSWDPHTGEIHDLKTKGISNNGTVATTLGKLKLKPFQSCFWVAE